MNNRVNTLCLGGFFALTAILAQPARADEWNKRTEFQFSAPVEIPGKLLAAGKYVFQLAISDSDRDIVQVFSEDSNGKETVVATLMAIPDYIEDPPDRPIVRFAERHSGSTEAIHSWFYPGENTGWKFVYPKGQTLEANTHTMPVPASVAAAAAPSLPPAPQVQEPQPDSEVAVLAEETLIAQSDMPAPPPTQGDDTQSTADRTLPQTGGYSGLQLMAGLVMFGGGLATVFASRRKSLA